MPRLEEALQKLSWGFTAHREDGVEIPEWTAGFGSRRGARQFSATASTSQPAVAAAQGPVAITGGRQDRFGIAGAAQDSRPRPRPVRRQASLPDLRSPAARCPSSAL